MAPPVPVNHAVYDNTIQFMHDSIDQARLGQKDKQNGAEAADCTYLNHC